MPTKTATKKKPAKANAALRAEIAATEKHIKYAKDRDDADFVADLQDRLARFKKEARTPKAQELRKILRAIETRAEELFDLVHTAMDFDDDTFRILLGDDDGIRFVRTDLNASPRDLDLLRNAIDVNLTGP